MRKLIIFSVFHFIGLSQLIGCSKLDAKKEVWIYTSVYKDTVSDLQKQIEAKFPEYKVNFYQAGSEEVAAKVNAEELAGGTRADILIFSDRFWFEEMAAKDRLQKYAPQGSEKVPEFLKNPAGFYAAVSIPVMVMIYNSEVISAEKAPKTFKEMSLPQWKGQFTTGSPLASGTNFTTVAFLQKAYGWDYFRGLRKNDTIAEGGNSSVIRRVQTKERPIGWVLLENVLRYQEADSKMKVVYPDDGVVIQSNILALSKKQESSEHVRKIADWFYTAAGQEAMIRSFMYAAVPGYPAPKGAPEFDALLSKAQKWSPEVVAEFMKDRESIKEEFAKIMLQ
jgi:iron(III) transport system substrate-binding protein